MSNWTQLILLLIAAVASGVLLLRNTGDDDETASNGRLGLGYYMTSAELIVTGLDGQTRYRVRTENVTQNTESDTIELDKVYVEYDPLSSIPWELRANTGHIPPERNIIELQGDVVAETRDEDSTPITIRTDFLELDTDTYIAETEHRVTIDYATNSVSATGMRAFFKEDRLQLLADVNGSFTPTTID
jgi:lipopolysaccharide export system protein LptC